MDRVLNTTTTTLAEKVRVAVDGYAGNGVNTSLYYVENPDQQVFCVVVPYQRKYGGADMAIMVHIEGDLVIVDVDKTNKPVAGALEQEGIPRSQIRLAWEDTEAQPSSTP